MPRFFLLTEQFPPPFLGGSERYLYEVFDRIEQADITIFTEPLRDGNEEIRCRDVRFVRRWYITSSGHSNGIIRKLITLRMLVFWTLELAFRCLTTRPECLFAGQLDPVGVLAWMMSWLFDIPYVTFVYGEELTKRKQLPAWRRWLRKKVCLNANQVAAISQFTRSQLVELGVARAQIVLIPPGVNARRFTPDRDVSALQSELAPHSEKLLLTVGRLTPRKGHALVLSVLPRVLEIVPDLRYVIVGPDWGERERLEQMIRDLNLQEQVVFLGRVSEEELPLIYAACDVFVMANYELEANADTEGFGIVFLEASACGKPVIGGRAGGVVDAVIHEETGLLVDAADPEELSTAIVRLLTDVAYARQLGMKGRQRVLERFSWERTASLVREAGVKVAAANATRD